MHAALLLSYVLLLTGCLAAKKEATCVIDQASGSDPGQPIEGDISFSQEEGMDITINIDLSGFNSTDGEMYHGFHVHANGNLGNNCLDAGGHYNPEGNEHAAPNDTLRHVGDLGNVIENGAGKVVATITDSKALLFGNYSILGKSIVVHAGRDDLGLGGDAGSKATGNAGPRLGCCVITEKVKPSRSPGRVSVSLTIVLLSVISRLL